MQPALPHIVLVRPQEEGNLGAVARAMANMGLSDLVVVEPGAAAGPTARAFAVGAGHLLDRHRRVASLEEALAGRQRVVATTSTRARVFGGGQPLVTPRELPAVLAGDPPGTATAIVFGPEPSGLTDAELALASPLVWVPCAPEQPTLNLAQAVLIVAYELFLARLAGGEARAALPQTEDDEPAPAGEVAGLLAHVRRTLTAVGFARDGTFEQVSRDLTRLAGRAALNRREVAILRGICRRTLHALRAGEPPENISSKP